MMKLLFQLFIALFFSGFCFSQVDEISYDSGSDEPDTVLSYRQVSAEEVRQYVTSLKSGQDVGVLGGYINSIFNEPVDSAIIHINIEGIVIDNIKAENGLFRLTLLPFNKGKLISLVVTHNDYHPFDTTFIFDPEEPVILDIHLTPRYKILLKGRVYSRNMPLEGVNVEIKHLKNHYELTTRGCFYDKDDYWNCLFYGMFKQELIADDPSDSIYISFEKEGMKPLNLAMTFAEYTGEPMQLKMKYTSRLSYLPINNLNLKLAFPFTTSANDWYVGLSYYRLINIADLKRLALGLDANMLVSTITVEHPTFPGLELASSDSSYISGFIGPSIQIWLFKPDRRYFATYAGCTFALAVHDLQFVIQPYIGTRILLDFNKALSLELKYYSYEMDIVHYKFNEYGNADRYFITKTFNKFLVNIGVQVLF
jgi:hypothetical protein